MRKLDGPYFVDEEACRYVKQGKTDDPNDVGPLTNFLAWIEEQHIYHDGPRTRTVLTIKGKMIDKDGNEVELKQCAIEATELKAMSWVSQKWGMTPILWPLSNVNADLTACMQIFSEPKSSDVYTHTGWSTLQDKPAYLTMSGAITKAGLNRDVTVSLPAELQRFSLPDPKAALKQDVLDSLGLLKIGPRHVLWPAYLATFRAAIGPADFAIFIAGRTGTFKSELASLLQSHYGAGMTARALPASWNSTANALEALAYKAKDALMVCDDYVPVGTGYQLRALEGKVDQVLRAQGNQTGRTRLNDTAGVQGTMYPRGILLNTGEDIPTGHSIRGRMMTSELAPGDIPPQLLTNAQGKRASFAKAMADWILWLAGTNISEQMKSAADTYRDTFLGIGHSRTPGIAGDLMATAYFMAQWCEDRKYLTKKQAATFCDKAMEAIKASAENQRQYLITADPIQIFCTTLKMLLQTGKVHAATKSEGVPEDFTNWGWTQQAETGGMPSYKSNGPCVAWLDAERNELLVDPNVLPLVKKHSEGRLSQTDQTFAKRLKEAQMLTRIDSARQRNTVRMTLGKANRLVYAMNLEEFLKEDGQ